MGLRIGNVTIDDSMDLKIGTELVGGLKVGSDIVYQWTPPPTVFEWSGALNKASGFVNMPATNKKLPTAWVVAGADAYLRRSINTGMPTFRQSSGQVTLHLVSTAGSSSIATGPQFTPEAESGLRMEFVHATAGTLVINGTGSDTDEPYQWIPNNSAEVTAWANAVGHGDNVACRFSLESTPPPAPASHSFDIDALTIHATAAGRFGNINETFTLGGQSYTITSLFTHNNGVQFRFGTNAQALAFIAAGFTVDLGISGQSSFLSSIMANRVDLNWAQYQAYPGRFVGGVTYTITITEAA